MLTPSTAELRTAIEVLQKLGQRLNEHADHFKTQLPDTSLGNNYAAKAEVQTIEQTSRITAVAEQLKHWRNELLEQRKQHVSQSI
jgi:hypothetical protein